MNTLLQDLKYALRSFRKSPGFTLTALLTVALGIGANTAIFSVVNGVLLRPLPYADPAHLVLVGHRYKQLNLETGVSAVGSLYYHDQNRVFSRTAAFTNWQANLARGSEPERLVGQAVAAEYFATLGVPLLLGREFTAEEQEAGKDKVVVLSEALWARAFARDRGILNRTVVVNGEAHTVIGVAREGFRFGTDAIVIWKPLVFTPDQRAGCWGCEYLGMLARVKPGITPEAVQSDLDRITRDVRKISGSFRDENWSLYSKLASEQIVGNVRPALLVLMGAVGFVLLIACANLANLMLARATARQREIAIRTAMGAGRWRLARQLLTETVLLSGAGGGLGLGLAAVAVKALIASNPVNLPRIDAVGLDGPVLLFTAGVTVLLGVLFGLAPAIQAARPAVQGMLKDGVRTSHQGNGLRGALVVSEVTLAIVLLIGSGLMLKSFRRWVSVDPGFQPERVLTFGVSLPEAKYAKREQQLAFFDQLRAGIGALPGVVSVGGNVALPMSNSNWTRSFEVEGYQAPANSSGPWGDFRVVTPGYFETMGIPVKRGRTFNDADIFGGRLVAVVDEVLAHKYWPGQDAVGKRVGFQGRDSTRWLEIVGVVGHVMQNTPRDDEHTQLYQVLSQFTTGQLGLAVRTRAEPLALAPSIRRLVLSIDPQQPIFDVRPMDDRVSSSSAQPRFLSLLLTLFAGVAATLAAIGIYGVMSYTVAQQTRELGIRLALGAERSSVLRLVLNRGLVLAGLGVGIGVVGTFALTKLMATQLFQVLFQTKAVDLPVFAAMGIGLIAVAAAATLVPARRATRVDPMVALRAE